MERLLCILVLRMKLNLRKLKLKLQLKLKQTKTQVSQLKESGANSAGDTRALQSTEVVRLCLGAVLFFHVCSFTPASSRYPASSLQPHVLQSGVQTLQWECKMAF